LLLLLLLSLPCSSSSSRSEGKEREHLLFDFLPCPFLYSFLKTSKKHGVGFSLGEEGGREGGGGGGGGGGGFFCFFLLECLGGFVVPEAFEGLEEEGEELVFGKAVED
jgi:hypothetical protein